MTRPARHRAARFAAVALLVLVVGMISGLEFVTTAGADGHPLPSPAPALLTDVAVRGDETVGVQAPRTPAVARADGIATARSAMLVAAALAAGLACAGARRRACRATGNRLPSPPPRAWAGPGGRRAPPLGHVRLTQRTS